MKTARWLWMLALVWYVAEQAAAQGILRRVDSLLSVRYYRVGNIDTAYIVRPQTKWTVTARLNESGQVIETEGTDHGNYFKAKMQANNKTTVSVGVSFLGFSVSAALNPAKLAGRYSDFELNLSSYGRRFGFEFIYQDAKNYEGYYDEDGAARLDLPDGLLHVKTLNLNTYYALNARRFSYPAAFSQSYIQRRSAGSLLLAASALGQRATIEWTLPMEMKLTNIGIGAGYGYNFVPGRGWLLHISALPTFIVYSHTSVKFGGDRIPLDYHFPEFILTGRSAVVKQWSSMFAGMSMVFNYCNIGDRKKLAVYNSKWYVRTFVGMRF